jgi:hypothetical protein
MRAGSLLLAAATLAAVPFLGGILRSHIRLPLLLPALAGEGTPSPAAGGLLPNGDFSLWKDGLPEGWELRVGATSGPGKESEVRPGPEGGVLLRGSAATGQWRLLARAFDVKEGTGYRLSFEGRAAGLAAEARQFDNAYVGLSLPMPGGKTVDRRIVSLGNRPWAPEEVLVRARSAGRAEVWVFLTKTGSLEARNLRLEELRPEDSYDALVRNMGRYYSHFASKGVDWPKLAAARRAAALAARDEAGFVEAVRALLAELKDLHVAIRRSDGTHVPTFLYGLELNCDFTAVAAALKEPRPIGKVALAGAAGKDLGYLAVFSLPAEAEFAPVAAALDGMLDRRGILLDLRACSGGDERRALALASVFAKERTVYARTRWRSGPEPGDLSPPVDRVLEPRQARRFGGPVVCLVGPGCVSSGEGFAQMMAAIPGVVLAGRPTAGSSGNPAPVDLPNGVTVAYSRWLDLLPDGTPLEGRGVPPGRPLPHAGPGDPTFAAGLAILEGMAAKAGR